jgi:predicted RNA binding protein YcfA (HicA-like mRNA interferase family)
VARRDKLIRKIYARPPQARFSDVSALLIDFGWGQDRQKGSHVTFVKPGELPITVPVHDGNVGRVYLSSICDQLDIVE